MKPWKHLATVAALSVLALLAGSCNLGTPITPRTPTEVEGLTGFLVLADGTPASGAWVRVFAANSSTGSLGKTAETSEALALDSALTNTAGGFQFAHLSDGTYNLAAAAYRGDTALALYLPGIIVTGKTNLGTDTLQIAGSLTVQVRTNNVPLAGALCTVASGAWQAVSNDSGTCVITGVPPGTFQVTVSYPSFQIVVSGSFVVAPGTATAGGQVNLTATASTVPVLIAPAQNAIGVPRSPALTWMAASGATSYRVQVATDSLFNTFVDNDSVPATVTAGPNSRVVGPLAAGAKYYWRVVAVGPAGTFVSTTRRFITETVIGTPPNPPVLVSPAQFATGISRNPVLTWNAAGGAMAYRVQVSTSASFTSLIVNDSAVTGTSRAIGTLATGTAYYWRVNARNTTGTSAYSTIFTFTTGTDSGATALTVPVQILPAAFATNVARSPNLTWGRVSGATSYHVQVSTSTGFTTFALNDSNATDTSRIVVPALAAGTTYYWRVRARNGAVASGFSTARSFTTETVTTPPDSVPPSVPQLTLPAQNATGVAVPPTFNWIPNGGTSFRLQVAVDSLFAGAGLKRDTVVLAPPTPLSGLQTGTVYFWRVQAMNAAGTSGYSGIRRFVTASPDTNTAAPATPVLNSPAQFATGTARSLTLTWLTTAGATSYQVQVSTSTTFTTLFLSDSNVTGITRPVSSLAASTDYYWRVRARNAAGMSAYSTVFKFTTGTAGDSGGTVIAPNAPNLTTPVQFATNVSRTPTMAWSAVPGATSYQMQVSTTTAFASLVRNDSNLTGTSRAAGTLAGSTDYYWRVRAKNSGGTSVWSEIRAFTTMADTASTPAIPPAPALLSPGQFATGVALSPNLSWAVSSGAGSYHVQVSINSAFSSFVMNDSNVTTTSRNLSGLTASTDYYWRVRARNAAGVSLWSTVSRFTTVASTGSIWTPRISATTNGLYGVGSNDSAFIALGAAGTVRTSFDGIAGWTPWTSGTTVPLYAVAKGGTLTAAVGQGGTILTSPSGFMWTTRTSGTTSNLNAVTWGGTQFVAVGAGGAILTSANGTTWTPRTSSTTANLNAVAWTGTRFVAAGGAGTILTSADGVTWTPRTSATTATLYAINGNDSLIVAVGTTGAVLTSSDGITWTMRTSGTTNTLYGVTKKSGTLIAVGAAGTILTSVSGGNTWSPSVSGVTTGLYAVTSKGAKVVVVGDAGVILTQQ